MFLQLINVLLSLTKNHCYTNLDVVNELIKNSIIIKHKICDYNKYIFVDKGTESYVYKHKNYAYKISKYKNNSEKTLYNKLLTEVIMYATFKEHYAEKIVKITLKDDIITIVAAQPFMDIQYPNQQLNQQIKTYLNTTFKNSFFISNKLIISLKNKLVQYINTNNIVKFVSAQKFCTNIYAYNIKYDFIIFDLDDRNLGYFGNKFGICDCILLPFDKSKTLELLYDIMTSKYNIL